MDIFKLYFDEDLNLILQISIWLVLALLLLFIIYFLIMKIVFRYSLVKVNIKLGNVGTAEFRPNKNDIQIAHKIWTQLVTRKAAIPIDKENDVIEEIYDSWYALFQKVREFISEIPAELIRNNSSTKEIVRIATQTLNEGLRPHLTKWQARFRSWSTAKKDKLLEMTPQDFQKKYPEYNDLIEDLIQVNQQLIQYAQELKKIIEK
jgi:ABC-type multidrug transport system fused ATPase/permease subunit